MRNSLITRIGALAALLSATLSAAAYDFEADGIYYNILSEEDKTVEVTHGHYEYNGDIVIPSALRYSSDTMYKVVSIGDSAFYYCKSLTSITIPNSVTSIGEMAFYACAFPSVVIPMSVTSIGLRAFAACYNLNIEVDDSNSEYSSVDGILYNKQQTSLICCPDSKQGDMIIPGTVTSIEDWAFCSCGNLTSVTIPNSVISIGKEAFYECYGLTSITIPNSVMSIGELAFVFCENLLSVALPNSVTSIGAGAFSCCIKLTDIEVDSDNKSFASVDGVLYDKSQTRLLCCPGGKRGDMIIPNSVTSIEAYAFYFCEKLQSVTIPNSVISIGRWAFADCASIKSIIIPNTVTSIEERAFWGCYDLTSVAIPNSVTSIGEDAFCACYNLNSVTIPNSVTSIGNMAFAYCDNMTTVYVEWEKPLENCGSDVFVHNKEVEAMLYVPRGCAGAYKAVEPWSGFSHIQEYDVENGIEAVEWKEGQPDWRVEDWRLIVDGEPVPVRIFNAAGVCVYAGASDYTPELPRGIYVVRIGTATAKLAI